MRGAGRVSLAAIVLMIVGDAQHHLLHRAHPVAPMRSSTTRGTYSPT